MHILQTHTHHIYKPYKSLRAGRTGAVTLWGSRWSELFLAVTVRFATRASRLMSGGVIPASTGRNVVFFGRMHPVIIRIVSFSATFSFLVWVLRHQAGDANSAARYTRASVPVRSVEVYAPQLEPARQRRRPFLAFTLLWRLSIWFFYASGTGRESHQGKPDCYCLEEEQRSQLHRAVDVCPCYLKGRLSSWS